MNKVFDVKAPRVVKPMPNGTYSGIITDIKYRDTPYLYADIVIQVDNLPDTSIEASFPAKEITPSNGFGKFIWNWKQFKVGEQLDPATILVGKLVSFMVMNAPGKNDPSQMYPQVVKGSLFPKQGTLPTH